MESLVHLSSACVAEILVTNISGFMCSVNEVDVTGTASEVEVEMPGGDPNVECLE